MIRQMLDVTSHLLTIFAAEGKESQVKSMTDSPCGRTEIAVLPLLRSTRSSAAAHSSSVLTRIPVRREPQVVDQEVKSPATRVGSDRKRLTPPALQPHFEVSKSAGGWLPPPPLSLLPSLFALFSSRNPSSLLRITDFVR